MSQADNYNNHNMHNLSKNSDPETPVEISPSTKQIQNSFKNLENHLNDFCKNKSVESTPVKGMLAFCFCALSFLL